MPARQEEDFLSLTPRQFDADIDPTQTPTQPHLDTLYTEFSRIRPGLSVSRSPATMQREIIMSDRKEESIRRVDKHVDLRTLDYVSEYDSHLMCPICHVPFVDPIVLDCDHTFCTLCFEEYRIGTMSSGQSQCPTCRAYLLATPRKASRLIVNMCNDLRVSCPNEGCDKVVARGYIEQHAKKDCSEQELECPDPKCGKFVKRKNFVLDQCIHSPNIECDCGAIIEMGRGEWLRHKDQVCPKTGVNCDVCNERISMSDFIGGQDIHACKDRSVVSSCPGFEFGCTEEIPNEDLETHISSCTLAKLAPFMKKQTQLLQSLQEQLAMTRVRNEILETGFDKINAIVNEQILPKLADHDPDIEEIERDHIPAAIGHRDLILPAHLRALTPSPDLSSQQHLLALHEGLRSNVHSLENDMNTLSNAISELDARSSMQLMNETLRIKEDLAHTNAALFSTRAQVQWMLNRERIAGQQMRGRTPSQAQNQTTAPASRSADSSQRGSMDAGDGTADCIAEGSQTTMPSPGMRPQLRRLSGTSQERVKL